MPLVYIYAVGRCIAHLCFSTFAIMAGNANFIEKAVQLVNYRIDLLGKVARVHLEGDVDARE